MSRFVITDGRSVTLSVGRIMRRRVLSSMGIAILSLSIVSCDGSGPASADDSVTTTSGAVETTTTSEPVPTTSPSTSTTIAAPTTTTSLAVDASQVIVTLDTAGFTVQPADVVRGPAGGVQLLIVNQTAVVEQVVFISIFAGSPDDLPVVDGLVDVSRCNQIFGGEDEDNPSPATFGCFGHLGEASPIEVVQIAAGETLPLDDGVQPGVHLIVDHQPGSYEAGRYVAFEVLEPDLSSGVTAISFDEIAGSYEKPLGGLGFLVISADGTIAWAGSRDDPDQATLTATFDETTVVITDPDCGPDVEGRYEIQQVDGGGIDVVLIEDSCLGRAGLIPGRYDPLG